MDLLIAYEIHNQSEYLLKPSVDCDAIELLRNSLWIHNLFPINYRLRILSSTFLPLGSSL